MSCSQESMTTSLSFQKSIWEVHQMTMALLLLLPTMEVRLSRAILHIIQMANLMLWQFQWIVATVLFGKKNYGGTGNDYGYTVKCLSNGNFVVSASKSVGTYNSWLLLLDSGGTEIFSTILSSYNSFCFAVDVLSDNSFITAGKTYGSGSGYYGFLTKVDSSGTKSWEQNFGNSGYTDIFYSVLVGASSNYLACGIYGNGNKLYILMTSTSGTSIWEKQIGSSTSTCYELKNLPDTNYIAVGSGYSSTTSSTDGWVIKFSYESTILYSDYLGGASTDEFYGVVVESDGGYTSSGYTKSYPTPSSNRKVCINRDNFVCQAGSYLLSAACTPCPVGTYTNSIDLTVCTGCSVGFYQPNQGKTSCLPCPIGTYQDSTSQTECIHCAEGSYQDTTGQATCKTCETNYYPNVLKTLCLYKGIFDTEASFTPCTLR
eukprot:TRINITY_DN7115_c0_g2_i1.p1 TRINITY_DN7115_c0_g2~~TRINITY_DN7115_c0_g2_i1.p1  ORF type:complete len:430 (+),score=-3.36 TRINITY_DN7115_c0_g2_i1:68-1357(+)